MTLPGDLQQLQEENAKLEAESLSLKEQQKKLEERVKSLEQRMNEKLKSQNNETRQVISQLESRINQLEQRLGEDTQKTGTNEVKNETVPQTVYLEPTDREATQSVIIETNPEILVGPPHESMAAVSPNDYTAVSKDDDSESHQDGETKKKRRFW